MRKRLLLATSLACSVWGFLPAVAEVAPAVPAVTVRAGEHPDFDRVVFDWPRDVTFSVKQEGTKTSVTFDAAASFRFTRDVTQRLSRARGFDQSNNDGRVTVSFLTSPGASVKAFASGTSVVLDITGKAAAETTAPSTPAPPAAKEAPRTIDKPQPPAAPVVTPPPPVAKAAPAQPEPQQEIKPTPVASPPTAIAPTAAALQPVETPPPPAALQTAATRAAQIVKAPPPDIDLSGGPVLVASFDPHMLLRAAIYQRAGYGYIVFENKLTLPADALTGDAPVKVKFTPLDLPKNSGFSFAMPAYAEIRATLDGTSWKIYLAKAQATPPVSSTLVPQPDFPLGARLLLPAPDSPEPVRLTDPVVGDELIVVPLSQSLAFNIERRMADLTVIPAAQGLVLKPLADRLLVRTISDGVEITAEGGLQLSRPFDTGASQQSTARARAAAGGKSIFDFSAWAGKEGETFTQTRQRLQQTIIDVPEAERTRARLELARFYFANGYGVEALSLLNMLLKQMPDLNAHGDFVALTGASKVLANRPNDGLRDLTLPLLAGQPEVELWQAIALSELRDWKAAEEKFASTQKLLGAYPEPFYSRYSILSVEAALAVGKDSEAFTWLDAFSKTPHATTAEPAIAYLNGALHAKAGRATAAEKAWHMAAASTDRLYKVRAELALIDLSVSTGSLTPAQAADRLEALRFAWRGDDLEVDILRRLGEFYIQARNVKAGLNSLAQAVALYPSSGMAPAIRAEMADIFRDVFLGDLGKKLSSIESLTLYQQYRDLMPTGANGDAVLRNLSERLVSIDLLDQAASILDELIKNRLQGDEKSRASLRLAGIRLLDHKPDAALAALDYLGEAVPANLKGEQSLLRARALSELHRDAEATALLKDNTSQGGRLLRADIAMRAHDWDAAAAALLDLVGPPDGAAASTEKADFILNAAIAYALANNQQGLDRLAIDYSKAMADSRQFDTFRMLTRPEKTGQLRDLAAAQAQLTQVDMFRSVLNGYRTAPANHQ